jgi:hypothetical protein
MEFPWSTKIQEDDHLKIGKKNLNKERKAQDKN